MLKLFNELDEARKSLLIRICSYHFDESTKTNTPNAKSKQVRAWIEKYVKEKTEFDRDEKC